MAKGKYPVTFRTRKSSPSAPMVLRPGGRGRLGRRRTYYSKTPDFGRGFLCFIDFSRYKRPHGKIATCLRMPTTGPAARDGTKTDRVGAAIVPVRAPARVRAGAGLLVVVTADRAGMAGNVVRTTVVAGIAVRVVVAMIGSSVGTIVVEGAGTTVLAESAVRVVVAMTGSTAVMTAGTAGTARTALHGRRSSVPRSPRGSTTASSPSAYEPSSGASRRAAPIASAPTSGPQGNSSTRIPGWRSSTPRLHGSWHRGSRSSGKPRRRPPTLPASSRSRCASTGRSAGWLVEMS